MKKGLTIFYLVSLVSLFQPLQASAQTIIVQPSPVAQTTNANQSATNQQGTSWIMGGVSMAIGGAIMAKSCGHPGGAMMCGMGAAGAAAGVADVAMGNGLNGTIAATGGTTCSGVNCSVEMNASGTNTANGLGGGGIGANVPQPVADAYNAAQGLAQQNGMDLNNPASVDAYANQNGGSGAGNLSLADLPPDVRAAAEKARADFLAKYNVSSVGFESGGGGNIARGGRSSDDDLNGFLNAINGKNANRNPASVEGLQKTLDGDAIGVAADDIFKQISRRYQVKIAMKLFLSAAPQK